MLRLLRLRSLWGVEAGPGFVEWKKRFVEWKDEGYDGVEIDLTGMGSEGLFSLRSICDEIGLEISVTIFSSWPQYTGPRPCGSVPDVHLDIYREQLRLASILKPLVINAQSGADYWTWDESVYFYRRTLEIDLEMGFEDKVCHETHRNRSLFNPYIADYVLQKVPRLKITGDFSHWVLVCERLLDVSEEDREVLDRIIPHVHHLHTRVGTTQSSQCPEPLHSAFQDERTFFERLWLRVIQCRQQAEGDSLITWVPEYGPFPYHSLWAAQCNGDVADSEGRRLEKLFNAAIGEETIEQ
ncbi:hypothetical protein V8C42DRAFT_337163 [Trichoderma barbatum]